MKKTKFKEVSDKLVEKGVLLSPDILEEEAEQKIIDELLKKTDESFLILNKDIYKLFLEQKNMTEANWKDFESATYSKEKNQDEKIYKNFLAFIEEQNKKDTETTNKVKIIYSYEEDPKKRTFQDFVKLFNVRFKELHNMLRQRQELQSVTSISRILYKKERENVAAIGMIQEKHITKNKNIILKLEDITGTIQVVVSKNQKEAFDIIQDCVEDEVIGVVGTSGAKVVFASKILLPDVPLSKELKKSPEEEYVIFLGDPHFGSKAFLTKEFEKFLQWINGKSGTEEQKEIAKKTKYMILTGDLVEGVGIYPGQEEDLTIKDIKEQYNEFANYLKQIPKHIQIIIFPGNHDAGRIAEPQPRIYKDFAEAVWELPNAIFLSNPGIVNIGATKDFSGFDMLVYHGYSLIYYADNVQSIREKGGQKRVDLLMKFLLQRRHLAPAHTSTRYIPLTDKDPLVISNVPDFFVTGHIHRTSVSNYRNVTMLNCSCWTAITDDQIKRGLEPQPGKVPVVNLKTREVKIMNFLTK